MADSWDDNARDMAYFRRLLPRVPGGDRVMGRWEGRKTEGGERRIGRATEHWKRQKAEGRRQKNASPSCQCDAILNGRSAIPSAGSRAVIRLRSPQAERPGCRSPRGARSLRTSTLSYPIKRSLRGHLKTRLKALQGKRFRVYSSVGQNLVWSKVARYFPNILLLRSMATTESPTPASPRWS